MHLLRLAQMPESFNAVDERSFAIGSDSLAVELFNKSSKGTDFCGLFVSVVVLCAAFKVCSPTLSAKDGPSVLKVSTEVSDRLAVFGATT